MTRKFAIHAWIFAAALPVLLVGGCKSSTPQADAMAQKDAFEASEEPAINARTHVAAGQLAEAQGNDGNAEKQYLKALEIDKKNQAAFYQLGILYVRQKKYDEAEDIFKQYVEVTDRSAIALTNLALTYQIAGKYNDAASTYEEGIKKDPKCVQCRVNYGLMLARRGQIAEATLQFQSVLTPAEVHYNLGSVYEELSRYEAAKKEYESALKVDPRFHDARVRLAALK